MWFTEVGTPAHPPLLTDAAATALLAVTAPSLVLAYVFPPHSLHLLRCRRVDICLFLHTPCTDCVAARLISLQVFTRGVVQVKFLTVHPGTWIRPHTADTNQQLKVNPRVENYN